MSGVLALLQLDGSPIDPIVLDRMARFLDCRGPHGRQVKVLEHVALAHALLDTSDGSVTDAQPFALDGTSIVADARLDARRDLIDALRAGGEQNPSEVHRTPN